MAQHFPISPIGSAKDYASAYFDQLSQASASSDLGALDAIASTLTQAIAEDRMIIICGNGGSAGIANHSLCDMLKCVRSDTDLLPRFFSLSAHTEMNSALANDISYDEVFAYQVQSMGRPGDVLWTVSSSGDSENVVRALEVAKKRGMTTISFTGFEGGRSRHLADHNAHVAAQNYGVVEDMHMSYVHILTQFLRMDHMEHSLLGQRKF